MRIRCNNCGGVYDVLLPIPVSQLTRVHDRIESIHKGCKVHDPVTGLGSAGKAGKEVEVDAGDALDRKP
jgi:hypothetical protein